MKMMLIIASVLPSIAWAQSLYPTHVNYQQQAQYQQQPQYHPQAQYQPQMQYQPRLLPLPGKMVAAQQPAPRYAQGYGNGYARPVAQAPVAPLYPNAAPVGFTQVAKVPTAGYTATPVYNGAPSYTASQPVADPMQKPWYVGVKGEISAMTDDIKQTDSLNSRQYLALQHPFETGYGVGGVAGYRVHPNIRVEGELSFRSFALKDKVDAQLYLDGVVIDSDSFTYDEIGFDKDDYGIDMVTPMANVYLD